MATELVIKILTCTALAGLLTAVGLRLTWREVKAALDTCRLTAILLVNFILIPALAIAVASLFRLKGEVVVAMVLLAAAPFAPVVPVFARMARADLALAAGLTAIIPLASALVSPLAIALALRMLTRTAHFEFQMLTGLALLAATITVPLAGGVVLRHLTPLFATRLLRPMEVISEAAGALSLAFVTATEFGLIADLGWKAWVAMALISEVSLLVGWYLGGPSRASRQVVALGTSNRNIALALLVALQSFPGTAVASGVVGNGLLLIGLGLAHVAYWRFYRGSA